MTAGVDGLERPSIRDLPAAPGTGRRLPFITTLLIDVVSGNAIPVSWADVRADFQYPSGDSRAVSGRADVEGRAVLVTLHDERPASVSVRAESQPGDTYAAVSDMSLVVEV